MYGMTKTPKMRLELNQKDKLPNRTRPCEAQEALTQKENVKKDLVQSTLSEGGLGMTYKVGSTRRPQTGRKMKMKQTADVQIQTQPSPSEDLPLESAVTPASTTDVKEEIAKPDGDIVHSVVESARSAKSPNSLEVFIPRVEGMCTILI